MRRNGLVSALTARGIATTLVSYNPLAVIFTNEAAEVSALNPSAVVLVSYEESVRLLDTLIDAGVAADRIIGLDGLLTPRLAERTSPDDLSAIDGITLIGTTGDRAFLQRLAEDPDISEFIFAVQAYDCAIVLLSPPGSPDVGRQAMQKPAAFPTGHRRRSNLQHVRRLPPEAGGRGGHRLRRPDRPDCLQPAVGDRHPTCSTTWDISRAPTPGARLGRRRSRPAVRDWAPVATAAFTTQLQLALRLAGLEPGPDRRDYDDDVAAAVAAFQVLVGLPTTGQYDAATHAALRQRLGDAADVLATSTAGLQQALTDLGFDHGPIEHGGRDYLAHFVNAIEASDDLTGVPPTGVLDVATLASDRRAGRPAGRPRLRPRPSLRRPLSRPPLRPPLRRRLEHALSVAMARKPTPEPTAPDTTAPPVTPPLPEQDLLEILRDQPELSSFVELLDTAGLIAEMATNNVYTVFVLKNNDAFAEQTMPTDEDEARRLVASHVVEGRLGTADLEPGSSKISTVGP